MPAKRPMDNMEVGFDRPQEDEFALCNLGLPSPYLKWAFPNTDTSDNALDLADLPDAERRKWVTGFRRFLRRLAFRDPRRTVLKSPTHTARVGALAAAFPGAQFVHIVRDPRAVFPSTVHTWRQMWSSVAFQEPTFDGIEEYVLSSFERMYRAFERDRPTLSAGQLHEVKYEDLIRDPVGELEKIYIRLGLEGFARAARGWRHTRRSRRRSAPTGTTWRTTCGSGSPGGGAATSSGTATAQKQEYRRDEQ